jgi:hypothetical protein
MRWVRRTYENFNGLITLADLLGVVGLWLYKGTARRTMAVALTFAGLLLLGRKVQTGVSLSSAVSGTGLILLVSFLGGLVLMVMSGSVARRDLKIAEAKGSNLLENLKQARSARHAAALWDEVFVHERELATPGEIAAEEAALEAEAGAIARTMADVMRGTALPPPVGGDVLSGIGLTERGFQLAFDYAVRAPLPRSLLRRRLRYDLSKVRHWYDGAPFHHTDSKLEEQYQAGDLLGDAQHLARYGVIDGVFGTWRRSIQLLWLKAITRAIQLRVAKACRIFDERYPDFDFLPDHFLWPHEAAEDAVAERLGEAVRDELIRTRRDLFAHVFNHEPELAKQLMQKAVYPNFALATELRRRFDPQYVAGELKVSWSDDLNRFGRAIPDGTRTHRRLRHFVARTRRRQTRFKHDPDLQRLTPGQRRALMIASHCDQRATLDAVLPRAVKINRMLRAVRTHHTLTRLELTDYEDYLDAILDG